MFIFTQLFVICFGRYRFIYSSLTVQFYAFVFELPIWWIESGAYSTWKCNFFYFKLKLMDIFVKFDAWQHFNEITITMEMADNICFIFQYNELQHFPCDRPHERKTVFIVYSQRCMKCMIIRTFMSSVKEHFNAMGPPIETGCGCCAILFFKGSFSFFLSSQNIRTHIRFRLAIAHQLNAENQVTEKKRVSDEQKCDKGNATWNRENKETQKLCIHTSQIRIYAQRREGGR